MTGIPGSGDSFVIDPGAGTNTLNMGLFRYLKVIAAAAGAFANATAYSA